MKDSEQRDVPIPDKLFEELKAWHEQGPGRELLFPTAKGKPDGHLLRELKMAVRQAGLHLQSLYRMYQAHEQRMQRVDAASFPPQLSYHRAL